ncbi:MAG: zinc-binding alcohol dehydrogenase [Planctomycetota bacterium]|nr:zinc-binding alcohol dehydrogenase [Planctomycetota bacterium]MDP6505595.1 zinc-binding alcohol dehydrogenase [Planctomycetota bacterium]
MSTITSHTVTVTAREQAELVPSEFSTEVGEGEIAGRTLASLVSAGTELNSAYLGKNFPSTPGYSAVIEVEQVGAKVDGFKTGDIAFCMSGHRSHHKVQAKQALPLPDGLSPEVGTFARMMCVSMTTLNTTTARPPARVLVCGLGLVGHLAAKNFQASGYEVFTCDPVDSRRRLASETGVQSVLDSVPLDDESLAGTFPLALECSGHEQALLDAARVIRKRGEVVCIATPWRRFTDLLMHDLHYAIFHNYAVIRSGWEWELPHHSEPFRSGSIFENLAGALRWLESGRVSVEGIYSKYSPNDAQQAYQDLLHKKTDRLAVVFDWASLHG